MLSVKGIIDKVASRKLAVAAAAAAAVATGAVEITLPVAIVAAAYIIGQGLVDTEKDGQSTNTTSIIRGVPYPEIRCSDLHAGNRRRHQPQAEPLRLPACYGVCGLKRVRCCQPTLVIYSPYVVVSARTNSLN